MVVPPIMQPLPASQQGGSGLDLNNALLYFEINNGATLTPTGNFNDLVWDTVPDGYTPGATLTLPQGLYIVEAEIDFAKPAEDRSVSLLIGSASHSINLGPFLVSAGATNGFGDTVYAHGIVVINADTPTSRVAVARCVLSPGGTPADLSIDYAYIAFTPIT